jgi:hypothetical protein
MYKPIKHMYLRASFFVVFFGVTLFAGFKAEAADFNYLADTSKQLKINALKETERHLYTLTIMPGSFEKAKSCDPPQTFYRISAELKNNSKDTLKYIDWSSTPSVWSFDKDNLFVFPSNLSPCNDSNDNYITYYTVPPHQVKRIQLSIQATQGAFPVNKKFKIGLILQRVYNNKDFGFYSNYFLKHELRDQTINMIWSNTIIMSR